MNNKLDIEKITKASQIFVNITQKLNEIIKPGVKILDIAEGIEKEIIDMGGLWAFPVNISIGNVAAHYTPNPQEDTVLPGDNIIKIDIGVSVDGHIVDGARSFYFGDNDDYKALIETANEALNLAISTIKADTDIAVVAEKAYDYIKSRGFKPISNLHGHQISPWKLHGDKEIPFDPTVKIHGKFEVGELYAIEIFVTNGKGYAESLDDIRIYSLPTIFAEVTKPIKLPIHIRAPRELFYWVFRTRKTLPFSIRYLQQKYDYQTIRIGLAILEQYGLIVKHPVLVDKQGIVAQAEDTILVKKDGIEILTRPKPRKINES